jgi:adenylate cyclase
MAEERVQCRLAAILAVDVVGYSQLMEADDEGTVRLLNTCRQVIDGLVTELRILRAPLSASR